MAKKRKTLEFCVEDMNSRQLTLKKYYPFFEIYKLNKISSKFQEFDMSSLSLAVMHFLLVEGKLKEKGVSFQDIEKFLGEYIEKSTNDKVQDKDLRELVKYITIKLNNSTGEAFVYTYFDPKKREMVSETVKYIKYIPSKKNSEEYLYHLTNDGIDFFLQTKEFGEESKVTIYLLLLQQQLKNSDFEGVYNSVVKINAEVLQQIEKKHEVSESLLYAGDEGYKKYKEYCREVSSRLNDEHDLFATTYKMVKEVKDEYIKKANINFADMKEEEQENLQFLYSTDKELGLTIERHSNLLNEVVLLKKDVLNIRKERRRKAFKKSFNFETFFNIAIRENDLSAIKGIINPLLKPNIKKQINPFKIDSMFNFSQTKKIDDEINEIAIGVSTDEIITVEEMTKERILNNYTFYMHTLLDLIKNTNSTTLQGLSDALIIKYSIDSLLNADFSAFIFDLNEIREVVGGKPALNYRLIATKGTEARPCEEIYSKLINKYDELNFLKYIILNIECLSGSYCKLGNNLTITNFIYKR
ncbi:hypothetical protein [Clostridium sp.]